MYEKTGQGKYTEIATLIIADTGVTVKPETIKNSYVLIEKTYQLKKLL